MFLQPVYGHVGYLVSETEMNKSAGFDLGFFSEVFKNGNNIALMLGTMAVVILAFYFLPKISFLKKFTAKISYRLEDYRDLVPWMARLSLGIMLIGAGVNEILISQILPNYMAFSWLQIFLGFCFLAGFLLTPISIISIALYIFALSQNSYLLGNLDFLGLSLIVLIDNNGKPGIDDLLGISGLGFLEKLKPYLALIIRLTLGGAMLYLAIYEKFLHPQASAWVVEKFGLDETIQVGSAMWVVSAGLIEAVIALLITFGFYTRLASVMAFLVLCLSFFYFKESVSGHVTLFGALSILLVLANSD